MVASTSDNAPVAMVKQQSSSNINGENEAIKPSPTRHTKTTSQAQANDGQQSSAIDNEDNINVRPAGSTLSTSMPAPSPKTRVKGGSKARGKARGDKSRKRKRSSAERDEDDSDLSDDSEIIAPTTAITTESGRSIQRPTAFAPPPAPSPTTTPISVVKKKQRTWRRNPENAVCKSCLRGVSPASNMIVFCDGCNTPYHQWCHHPPIDQSVIDEADKEWYCRHCTRERIVPVPESEVAHFVAVDGASVHDVSILSRDEEDSNVNEVLVQKQKFFSSLTPGALVTLLVKATNLQPSLPVFDPDWAAKTGIATAASNTRNTIAEDNTSASAGAAISNNGLSSGHQQQPSTIYVNHDDDDEDEGYGPEIHPAHYVRPGKGLMSTLPPDKDDATHLVDEENGRRVFHHIFLVDEKAAGSSNSQPASK